jgi:hypothetical protein
VPEAAGVEMVERRRRPPCGGSAVAEGCHATPLTEVRRLFA